MRYSENQHSSPGHFVADSSRPNPTGGESLASFMTLVSLVLVILLIRAWTT